MEKFRWAYIGCGGIAAIMAEEILRSGEHEIAAVWNRTRSRAEAFAERFGGRVCGSIEEALRTPGVEGAYLATTANQHPANLRACIRCGVPALCEKPFAVNASEARALFEEAARAGVYVSEAMWTWHNDAALKVRDWIRDGRVGEIAGAKFRYGYPLIALAPHHRLRDPARIGGALLDIGIYPVRYCYELFGMPREIECRGELRGGVDFHERILLRYDGFTAEIRVAMDRYLGERGEISGSRGSIAIDQPHAARKIELRGPESEKLRFEGDLYARQFSNVAREIREDYREGVMIPASGTIAVMEILDECRRQMGLVYPREEDK